MQNDSKTASSSSTATTGDSQPPTEPVVLFDAEKNELKISVPYVPEYLSVTLWGTLGGNPTAPPAPYAPVVKFTEDDVAPITTLPLTIVVPPGRANAMLVRI